MRRRRQVGARRRRWRRELVVRRIRVRGWRIRRMLREMVRVSRRRRRRRRWRPLWRRRWGLRRVVLELVREPWGLWPRGRCLLKLVVEVVLVMLGIRRRRRHWWLWRPHIHIPLRLLVCVRVHLVQLFTLLWGVSGLLLLVLG